MADSPRRRLIELLLGQDGPLEDYVRQRRDQGRSWRLISRDLYETVGEDVTEVTVRSWCPDADEEEQAS